MTGRRYQGRTSDWQAAPGFGFVSPGGGGHRAFVHIRAIVGQRRPVDGTLVTYAIETDAQERLRATNVQFTDNVGLASARALSARNGLPLPVGPSLFFLSLAWLWHSNFAPAWLLFSYGLMSVISFVAYALDKDAAKRLGQRTPETTLHLLDLIGGWPGGRFAQLWLRHKSVKAEYQAGFWFTVILNLAALGCLVWKLRPSP